MKEFEYCVFIGRFQPCHLAHLELLNSALEKANTVILVIGSYKKSPDPKNPWTGEQREQMIRSTLSAEDNLRVKTVLMKDYLYNDNKWLLSLQKKVFEITGKSNSIALIGHEHDSSSYYLKLFPQWKFISMPNNDKYPHATDIRYDYFTYDNKYKSALHKNTSNFMEKFKSTEEFQNLKDYFDDIKSYKSAWYGSPFPPTIICADAVVIKSGHVLLVTRKKAYGRGLIALPGGHLEQDENLKTCSIRELVEETNINVSKEVLTLAIKDSKVFDHPKRSLRARVITQAFLFDLGLGDLPDVLGADDAEKAFWMPLSELSQREEDFFEDHYHIISHFFNKF